MILPALIFLAVTCWLSERPDNFSVMAWPDSLCETFAHELAHYEQWRSGFAIQERGVAVRARTIARKLKAVTP